MTHDAALPGKMIVNLGSLIWFRHILSLLIVLTIASVSGRKAHAEDDQRQGHQFFQIDFESPTFPESWRNEGDGKADLVSVPGRSRALVVDVSERGNHMVSIPVPINQVRGFRVTLSGRIKAENVSKPAELWNGVKLMLVIQSPTGTDYQGVSDLYGSFDWKNLGVTVMIPPDATEASIVVGLQDASGKSWFDDVALSISATPRKRPDTPPALLPPEQQDRRTDLPRLRGVMYGPKANAEDLHTLAEWNGNLIRFQFYWYDGSFPEKRHDLALYEKWLVETMDAVDKLLPVCEKLGIRVVIDLHTPPGAVELGQSAIFQKAAYQKTFIEAWDRLALRYKDQPAVWGYDLLNEPVEGLVADGLLDWRSLADLVARRVRAIDPHRAIIIEPGPHGGWGNLPFFEPLDVPGIVYSVHVYDPLPFTHQGILNGMPEGLEYPGTIGGVYWDKNKLRETLEPVRQYQKDYNVPMYIGEFSAPRWAPGDSAARYLRDCIELFEEYGWDWSYHAFREWHAWNVELGPNRDDLTPASEPTSREMTLREFFSKNLRLIGKNPATRDSGERLFPPDAVVNVTLPPYEARPNDGKDDTAAIQRAISENVDSGRMLFFPAGTYDLSDTLVYKNTNGLWRPHLTLQGQGRDMVILKLADSASGYGDTKAPKAVIATGSFWQEGDHLDGGGNKAFRNNIFDLTIDTGSGNPGAVGVDYAVSNQGAIKDVTIRSGDGGGVAGITLLRRIPGPGLIKHVEVIGFDTGIDIGDIQYGMTIEHVTLRGQRTAGIRTTHNVLHIRKLTSVNRIPAVSVTGDGGVLTLLDSSLTGGSTNHAAVVCFGTKLIRNVTTEGYRNVTVETAAALLPIEETPDYWNANLDDWEPVGARINGEADDTAAIQRAIDSGKSTVYFPHSRAYHVSDTVVVRGAIRQILGMGAELTLGAAEKPFSDRENPRPLFRIDQTHGDVVFFENMFFNAQYPGEVLFENNTPATVVIKHSAGWVGSDGSRRSYRNTTNATGQVFIEDVFLPGWEFNRQTVWARQFNPENYDGDGKSAQVSNTGGKLWILGFKTEGPAPFISTSDGGVTELLGGYNYISATQANPVPVESAPYVISDSRAALTFISDNFRDNDYRVYIRETVGDHVTELKGSDLPPRRGPSGPRSFAVPIYTSGHEPE